MRNMGEKIQKKKIWEPPPPPKKLARGGSGLAKQLTKSPFNNLGRKYSFIQSITSQTPLQYFTFNYKTVVHCTFPEAQPCLLYAALTGFGPKSDGSMNCRLGNGTGQPEVTLDEALPMNFMLWFLRQAINGVIQYPLRRKIDCVQLPLVLGVFFFFFLDSGIIWLGGPRARGRNQG